MEVTIVKAQQYPQTGYNALFNEDAMSEQLPYMPDEAVLMQWIEQFTQTALMFQDQGVFAMAEAYASVKDRLAEVHFSLTVYENAEAHKRLRDAILAYSRSLLTQELGETELSFKQECHNTARADFFKRYWIDASKHMWDTYAKNGINTSQKGE